MSNVYVHSLFSEFDIDLFKSGKHFRLYEKLGSHPMTLEGEKGTYFAVWAPSAKSVSVVGDFNYWLEGDHKLNVRWDGVDQRDHVFQDTHQACADNHAKDGALATAQAAAAEYRSRDGV